MSKDLFIVRGLPSSGKTTFAHKLCHVVISADDYFEKNGEYLFDSSKLHIAHKQCQTIVEENMYGNNDIAVANTFTTDKEMKPYFDLDYKYCYTVTTFIVESRHCNKNDHNVPNETVEKMRNRFNVVL